MELTGPACVDLMMDTARKCHIPYCPAEQNTKNPFAELSKSVGTIRELGFEDLL